jgi:enamine deaminase RidA (YjgF/YER057c/UK114 family)
MGGAEARWRSTRVVRSSVLAMARAQTEHVFRNLSAALAGAGANFRDVIELNINVRDMKILPAYARSVIDIRLSDHSRPPPSLT